MHFQLNSVRQKREILINRAEECSRQAALATDPLIRHDFLALAVHWLELSAAQQELEAQRERLNASPQGSSGKALPEILINREAWLRDRRKAIEMAMMGKPLETTLGVLIRTASDVIGGGYARHFI